MNGQQVWKLLYSLGKESTPSQIYLLLPELPKVVERGCYSDVQKTVVCFRRILNECQPEYD